MPSAAVLYCRLSRPDGTDGESLSIDRQRQYGHDLADRLGWTIAAEIIDDGVSAWQPRKVRPGYRQMLRDIAAGRYDGLIVYDHYRLHRQPHELEEFFTVCDRAGLTHMASYAGEYDLSSSDGKFTLRIMGAVGAKESDDKSRRIKAKLAQRAAEGGPHGGVRPFGYAKGGLVVDEGEAEIVRHFVDRVLSGASLLSVAREANANGWRTTMGNEWSTRSMRLLLLSERVAGWRVHRGQRAGKAEWPALIDEVTHQRLVRLLMDPSRLRPGGQSIHLLSGVVVCAVCGQRMRTGYRKGGARRYACQKRPAWPGCGTVAVTADPVDELVRDLVCAAVDGGAVAAALAATDETEGQRRELVEAVAADEERLTRLAEDHFVGLMPRAAYLSTAKTLNHRLDRNRRALGRLDAVPTLRGLPADGADLAALWDDAGVDWRRGLLSIFVESVVVSPASRRGNRLDPDRVRVVWR